MFRFYLLQTAFIIIHLYCIVFSKYLIFYYCFIHFYCITIRLFLLFILSAAITPIFILTFIAIFLHLHSFITESFFINYSHTLHNFFLSIIPALRVFNLIYSTMLPFFLSRSAQYLHFYLAAGVNHLYCLSFLISIHLY